MAEEEVKEEKLTWRDIKELANKLTEEELESDVIWWGEEEGGKMQSAFQLEEDHVSFGEGMEPVSVYEGDPVWKIEEADALVKKGTPILLANF